MPRALRDLVEEFYAHPDNAMLIAEIEEINRRDPTTEPLERYLQRIIDQTGSWSLDREF